MESRSAREPRPMQWLLLAMQWLLLGTGVVVWLAVTGLVGLMLVSRWIFIGPAPVSGEAKANLKALYVTQRAWSQEKDSYTEDLGQMEYAPELGNQYTYFAAPSGRVLKAEERRGPAATEGLASSSFQIIAADPMAKRFRGTFETFEQTGCPLTLATLPDGTRAGLGVTRSPGAESNDPGVFIGAAAANIDGDPTPDCWSIATVERVTASGERILAGQPYNELNDVEY